MKIALLSDVHANLPAFKAALDSIESYSPDAIYCLGDLVGYNIWSNEVVEVVRRRAISGIAGNHDIKALPSTDTLPDLSTSGKDYSYHIISPDNCSFLLSLPRSIRLDMKVNDQKLSISLVHGSPRSISEYLLEELPDDYLMQLLDEAQTDILCFGHTHKPFYKIVNAAGRTGHFINTGSVGKPKDGDPRGGYVLLTINELTDVGKPLSVEFIRFEYDVEKAAQAIEGSPLPDEFADQLRKGY